MLPAWQGFSQTETYPPAPAIKSYKGVPGKITKYHRFNFIDIQDEDGKNNRQAMGQYWEISFNYDSSFRQKRKFREFVENQIVESNGSLLFQDTMQVHFVIPADGGNIWGRLLLPSDKLYRLRLIRETPFASMISFDTDPVAVFDKFVEPVAFPPRVNYLPNAVITRAQYSKFNHQEFTWTEKDTLFRQKVRGPYWDLKIEIRNSKNQVDKQVSTVEILESYYRACLKAGGRVLKSRPRELIFTMPVSKSLLWCRISVSLDGVYFVRVLDEAGQDRTDPVKMLNAPVVQVDSLPDRGDR